MGSGKGEGSGPACMLAATHNMLCCYATCTLQALIPSIGDEKHGLASPTNCWGLSYSNTSNSAEGETVELKGMSTGFILSITSTMARFTRHFEFENLDPPIFHNAMRGVVRGTPLGSPATKSQRGVRAVFQGIEAV